MAKFKEKKFVADAFISRDVRCAIVLEEYLAEINNSDVSRYAIKFMQNFNYAFKGLNTLKQKEFVAKLVLDTFVAKLKRDTYIPTFARTLLMNVIKTKFKRDILGLNNPT